MKRLVLFLSILAVLLLTLASCTPKASDTVQNFLSAYQSKEGNPNSFLSSNLVEPSYNDSLSPEMIREIDRLIREFSYEIESEKKREDHTEVTVVFKTKNVWKTISPLMTFSKDRPSNRDILAKLRESNLEMLRKKVTLSLTHSNGGWIIENNSDPELLLALHGNIPQTYESEFSEIKIICGVSESPSEDPDVIVTYENTSFDRIFSGNIRIKFSDEIGNYVGGDIISVQNLIPGEIREALITPDEPPFRSKSEIYAAKWTFFDKTSLSSDYDIIYQTIAPLSTFYLKVPDLTQQKADQILKEFQQNYSNRNIIGFTIFLFDDTFAEPMGSAPKKSAVAGSISVNYKTGIESVHLQK